MFYRDTKLWVEFEAEGCLRLFEEVWDCIPEQEAKEAILKSLNKLTDTCQSKFHWVTEDGEVAVGKFVAFTKEIQLNYKLMKFQGYSDLEIMFVIAHELAHAMYAKLDEAHGYTREYMEEIADEEACYILGLNEDEISFEPLEI